MRPAAQLLNQRKARDGPFKLPAPGSFSAPPQSPPWRATPSLGGLYGDNFHVLLYALVQIVAGRLLWVLILPIVGVPGERKLFFLETFTY